ncbi:Arc family DNA-binding protein [Variovorax paradoxus]|nr:Arc family DNA-binding protein [Variovorax paradoxus]
MVNFSIKDVPEELAERLRQRAARNHRSLQGELMAIIEQAATDAAPPWRASVSGTGWAGRPVLQRGSKSTEQIAAEHRMRFPEPIAAGPSAVDIVRAERDAR